MFRITPSCDANLCLLGVSGGTLSSFLLHFKAIFDGEDIPPLEAVVPTAGTSQREGTTDSMPMTNEETVGDGVPRNRNSRIYAEASEQMLGMGDRELDRE